MKKCQLTEYTAQDRKYWMTKILAGPVQGEEEETLFVNGMYNDIVWVQSSTIKQ